MDMEAVRINKGNAVRENTGYVKQLDKQTETSYDKKSDKNKEHISSTYKDMGDGNPITLIGDNNLSDKEKNLEENEQKKVKSAITEVNDKIKHSKSEIEFEYHEKSHRVSIKIIDSTTREIIKEIPPEDTIKMVEKMWEMAGLLVDHKL